jgi:hypothetical protein
MLGLFIVHKAPCYTYYAAARSFFRRKVLDFTRTRDNKFCHGFKFYLKENHIKDEVFFLGGVLFGFLNTGEVNGG